MRVERWPTREAFTISNLGIEGGRWVSLMGVPFLWGPHWEWPSLVLFLSLETLLKGIIFHSTKVEESVFWWGEGGQPDPFAGGKSIFFGRPTFFSCALPDVNYIQSF
jgi:hypothetical protein